MDWYSVKLLFRLTVSGEPDATKRDAHYSDNRLYFRESVLLVRADSVDHACVLAANTAKRSYDSYDNPYGQRVTSEFDRTLGCYRMADVPGSFTEVFSSVFPARTGENVDQMLKKRFEACPPDSARTLRRAVSPGGAI